MSLDDYVSPEDRREIDFMRNGPSCQKLMLAGRYFCYCMEKLDYLIKNNKASGMDAVRQARIDIVEMGLHCKGDYKNCYTYQQSQK